MKKLTEELEYILDELKSEECNVKYLIPNIEKTLEELK